MTEKTRIPFAPAAVRDRLRTDSDFAAVVPAEFISTRDVPNTLTRPFVTCRSATTTGRDAMLRKPMVQIDVWVPGRPTLQWPPSGDPEEIAWDIGGLAGEIIDRSSNIAFRNCGWAGNWVDGPMNLIDKTRGEDLPLYRAPVRVELTMRMDSAPKFAWMP
ncbi:hypothetical protein [Rhodococcus sp. JVH1]|uniref:hypothetical protein n=1 Tax=Rhodococcus sp. JVH1 TaxID=745408 RepID=UPI0002720805|nr:hypothetical protein [Rhodococcus sp. JVH1]EJJ01042.1 hypothetical protein JVH1_1668 [Rhodococcus sp. JVH1]